METLEKCVYFKNKFNRASGLCMLIGNHVYPLKQDLSSIWLGEQFMFLEVSTSNNNLSRVPYILIKYSDILHFIYSE